jgi:hypothetical protein
MFSKPRSTPTTSSSSTASTSEVETVAAVQYTSPATNYDLNTYDVTEYFVPSYNVGFNRMLAVQPTKPINIPVDHSDVLLPKSLVEQVVKLAQLRAQLKKAEMELSSNQEYLALLEPIKKSNTPAPGKNYL